MIQPRDLYEVIESAEHHLEDAKRRFLEKHGWNYTCQTPSCHWLWVKTLPDGRVVMTDMDFAISMQRHADSISEGRMPA